MTGKSMWFKNRCGHA